MAAPIPRRNAFKATLAASGATVGLATAGSEPVAADHRERIPDHVSLSFDEEIIERYRPQLVLEDVEPRPLAFYGLHATSTESSLNAVYGFTKYPFQQGQSHSDSHLGDHEPVIVFYNQSSGEVELVAYSAYHWFKGQTTADALTFATDARTTPVLQVDPTYHHHYLYAGARDGERIELRNLLDSIDGWLANGLEENLAPSQPFNPWEMLGRETWWRHTTGNWINAFLLSLWFNLGLSDAAATSDLSEVSTW